MAKFEHKDGYYWIKEHGKDWTVAYWNNHGQSGGEFVKHFGGKIFAGYLENVNWTRLVEPN